MKTLELESVSTSKAESEFGTTKEAFLKIADETWELAQKEGGTMRAIVMIAGIEVPDGYKVAARTAHDKKSGKRMCQDLGMALFQAMTDMGAAFIGGKATMVPIGVGSPIGSSFEDLLTPALLDKKKPSC